MRKDKGAKKVWKIVSITDHNGNVKQEFYDEIKAFHPDMVGDMPYLYMTRPGGHLCFLWDDDSDRMLRTSMIENMDFSKNKLVVTTRNSVYTFEEYVNSHPK